MRKFLESYNFYINFIVLPHTIKIHEYKIPPLITISAFQYANLSNLNV